MEQILLTHCIRGPAVEGPVQMIDDDYDFIYAGYDYVTMVALVPKVDRIIRYNIRSLKLVGMNSDARLNMKLIFYDGTMHNLLPRHNPRFKMSSPALNIKKGILYPFMLVYEAFEDLDVIYQYQEHLYEKPGIKFFHPHEYPDFNCKMGYLSPNDKLPVKVVCLFTKITHADEVGVSFLLEEDPYTEEEKYA